MKDCLFCSIAHHDKEKLLWENDVAAAFKDIHPKAPVHVLIVPKQHIEKLDDLTDPELAGQMILAVQEVARQQGIAGNYRLTTNNGSGAGQVVEHLHFHLLSGAKAPERFSPEDI